ncbi:CU044_2847 family protein [Streptomyces sp. IBSBF 2806]|uniref:CU044_2847 family protein n=1 Tax=Streptomyces sp. IBSBF 2806 TaxID=2903529 RepID=UPI002FDC1D04
MTELVRFEGPDGTSLIAEVDDDAPGMERISRTSDAVADARRRLDEAFAVARPAIRTVVETVGELAPDEWEIDFGIKLNVESGVVVARTAAEGHFTVKLRWSRTTPAPGAAPAPEGASGDDGSA